jgi:hypothetical protein
MHGHLNDVALSRIRNAKNIAVYITENDYDAQKSMVVTTNVVYLEICDVLPGRCLNVPTTGTGTITKVLRTGTVVSFKRNSANSKSLHPKRSETFPLITHRTRWPKCSFAIIAAFSCAKILLMTRRRNCLNET